jgi:protein-S-isoprenylcysteine O-methyltransferase Ste14
MPSTTEAPDRPPPQSPWRALLAEHGQTLVNLGAFLAIGLACASDTATKIREGRIDFVEISFLVQNLVMLTLLLARRRHRAVDPSPFRQAVALVAFFSGLAFLGQPSTGGALARGVSSAIVVAANLLGLATLLNLGRSFGILIAIRRVETRWLYRIVRHPMYGTDILLRIGYVASHRTPVAITLFVLSTACYVYRAFLEERFLGQDEIYRDYMKKVKYRFIPFLF